MRKLCSAVLLLGCLTGRAAVVDSLTYLFSLTKTQMDSVLTANSVPSAFVNTVYDIDVYKVRYNTVSYDSSPVYASGMLAFPTNTTCRLALASFGHGTTTDREGVPSRAISGEAVIGMVMASVGYVAALPDYIGLGDSPDSLLHPYQDARTEASATIDILRAARELAPQLNYRLNGQLFLSGYSQGGHTTMATHKTIQQQLANEFTVTASCPMSGPYDLSGVMVDVMLSDSDYAVPGYLPYLVFSWNQKYHFYNNPSDYLKAPYDSILPPLFNGHHSMDEINSHMPSVPKLIFKQEMIDSFANNPNHPFRLALADNDVYDWRPDAPVHIVFCRADQEVSWHNALTLYNSFKAHNAPNVDTVCVSETMPHYQCAQLAVLEMKNFFTPYQQLDSCTIASINKVNNNTFHIYPNPATGQLTIGLQDEIIFDEVVAVNSLGQQLAIPFVPAAFRLQADVKNVPAGIYVILGVTGSRQITLGRFVKQ